MLQPLLTNEHIDRPGICWYLERGLHFGYDGSLRLFGDIYVVRFRDFGSDRSIDNGAFGFVPAGGCGTIAVGVFVIGGSVFLFT